MNTPSGSQYECTTMSRPTENTVIIEDTNINKQVNSSGEKRQNGSRKPKKPRRRVSKACDNCARRKIKCDGNVPCMPCLFRGRSCQAKKIDNRRRPAAILGNSEKAWAQSLKEVYGEGLVRPLTEPFSPLTTLTSEHDETVSVAGSSFDLDGIYLKRSYLDRFFQSFCENTHHQYPFLHLPTLRARYAEISEASLLSPNLKSSNMERRAQISQIYVCLAIGKFSESCYGDGSKGSYPSGWGLYSAAVQIHGDFLMPRQDFQDPLLFPQTMLLMAIYLTFVDSTNLAKRLLSVAILQLKSMGCHQIGELENMPVFKDELLRRVWLYCFVLERELGIRAQLPFLISDISLDSNLPRNMSDPWLDLHREDTRNVSAFWLEIQEEQAANNLLASRIVITALHAKTTSVASRALYQGPLTDLERAPALIESLENLVEEAERKAVLVQRRKCREGLTALHTKEEVLTHIKWCYLRLLISQTVLQQPQDLHTSNAPGKEGAKLTSLHLVDKILRAFQGLPNEYPKFTFPYVEYWVDAVVSGVELITDDSLLKQCYGSIVYQGLESLQGICSRTSMSVQITRRVLTMSQATREACSDEPGSDNASAGQTSTHFKTPFERRSSPAGLVMPENGEGKMSLCEYLPSATHILSPSDIAVAEMADSASDSTAYSPISALQDINGCPSHFNPISLSERIERESTRCNIQGISPPPCIREANLSNSLECDTFELELDPTTFCVPSDANVSLFQDLQETML